MMMMMKMMANKPWLIYDKSCAWTDEDDEDPGMNCKQAATCTKAGGREEGRASLNASFISFYACPHMGSVIYLVYMKEGNA